MWMMRFWFDRVTVQLALRSADPAGGASRKRVCLMSSIGYTMRIVGTVPDWVLCELDEAQVSGEPASTVLTGIAVDESALHGVLNRLQFAGLQLLEFRRLPIL